MNSEWHSGRLGDFIELKRGYDLPQAKRIAGSVPLVSSSGVSDYHAEAMVKGPGVITGRYGTIGQVYYVEDDYWPLNTTLYVCDFKGNYPKFVSYFLKTVDFFAYSDKAAVPGVNRNHLHEASVVVPPLQEQKTIAHFLGVLDDRITLLRETNTLLEQIAQTLFKSWFVDFDPVRAKQEGRIPEGMDEETAALFPDSFEESELGLVPKGWKAGKLCDLLTESTARVGGHDAIVLSAIQTGALVLSQEHFNKRVHSADISKYKRVNPRSFAYNPSRINIGSIGLNESDEIGAVSPIYVVANSTMSGYEYIVWHHLRRKQFKEHIQILASGTVRQSLSFKDFSSIPIVIPTSDVVEAFIELRSAIYSSVMENSDISQILVNLRDTLLPRLISGKLRLPEAEEMIQEAVS